LRIDHILLTAPLAQACTCSIVDREMRKLERPSDRAPVVAEISLGVEMLDTLPEEIKRRDWRY